MLCPIQASSRERAPATASQLVQTRSHSVEHHCRHPLEFARPHPFLCRLCYNLDLCSSLILCSNQISFFPIHFCSNQCRARARPGTSTSRISWRPPRDCTWATPYTPPPTRGPHPAALPSPPRCVPRICLMKMCMAFIGSSLHTSAYKGAISGGGPVASAVHFSPMESAGALLVWRRPRRTIDEILRCSLQKIEAFECFKTEFCSHLCQQGSL